MQICKEAVLIWLIWILKLLVNSDVYSNSFHCLLITTNTLYIWSF